MLSLCNSLKQLMGLYLSMELFTNRELAIIIWTTLFILWGLTKKGIRNASLNVLKCALNSKLLFYFFTYLAYISIFTFLFYYIEIWNLEFLKESILWFLFSGLSLGIFVVTNKLEIAFWKRIILENFKIAIIVGIIVSSFNFSFAVEIILIPFSTFLILLNTFSESYEEYHNISKYTNISLIIFGLILLFYSSYKLITEITTIESISYFKSFLFPLIYSIVSIPYLCGLKIWSEYDTIFSRLKYDQKISKKLNLLIKFRLLLFCNIQIKKLQVAANMNNYNLMSMSSKDDIDDMIQSYRKILSKGACLHDNKHVFENKENVEDPTDLEFEIHDYFQTVCEAEWEKVDLNDPNQFVDEYQITQDIAKHYGISKEDVEYILLKVNEYQRHKS